MRPSLIAGCLAVAACSSNTEPSPYLEPGLYVLGEFRGRPVPALLAEIDYGTVRRAEALVHDSVTVENDSTCTRSVRTVHLEMRPGAEADTVAFVLQRYTGRILHREGAVLLVGANPALFDEVVELRPVPGGFIRRLRYSERVCTTVGQTEHCEIITDELLDASYPRR